MTAEKSRQDYIKIIVESTHAMKRKFMMCPVHKSSKIKPENAMITHSQWAVLGVVMEKKEVGVKEIAATLGITSSAATQLVDTLVENNYLIREADKNDRRALKITISDKYKLKMKKMKQQAIERFTDIFTALDDKELALYAKLNNKILTNLTK